MVNEVDYILDIFMLVALEVKDFDVFIWKDDLFEFLRSATKNDFVRINDIFMIVSYYFDIPQLSFVKNWGQTFDTSGAGGQASNTLSLHGE